MAPIAEVRCTKTEKYGYWAAVSTFVLKIVSSVLGAELSLRDVAATSTDEFLWVKLHLDFNVASSISSKVRLQGRTLRSHTSTKMNDWHEFGLGLLYLFALIAQVVRIAVHCKGPRLSKEASPRKDNGLAFSHPFVLESHQRLPFNVDIQLSNRAQDIF
jgi:hypothetical protein